jgi:hypothetical protein
MRPSVPDVHITDAHDTELATYRVLPGQAVLGLIFGLLAPLALIDPVLWAVPVLGAIFSRWALVRIGKNASAMTGRKMALTGLVFSLLFLTAAPTHWCVYRRLIRSEARQFCDQWFKYLAQDEPQKAYQLLVEPQERPPLDDRLWDYYRSHPATRKSLERNVTNPMIRTLLALGPGARVRFCQAEGQRREKDADAIRLWYAVTYEETGERKSFFVHLELTPSKQPSGTADWRVLRLGGGARPEGWEQDGDRPRSALPRAS